MKTEVTFESNSFFTVNKNLVELDDYRIFFLVEIEGISYVVLPSKKVLVLTEELRNRKGVQKLCTTYIEQNYSTLEELMSYLGGAKHFQSFWDCGGEKKPTQNVQTSNFIQRLIQTIVSQVLSIVVLPNTIHSSHI